MSKLISKTELITQNNKSDSTIHSVGEIYPEIFSCSSDFDFKIGMPLETTILYLGAYQLDSTLFPKLKCPICGKDEVLIPYLCGGSILSGSHTIQFYCLNCNEQFVTNDNIEYFRLIYRYVQEHYQNLKLSPVLKKCTKASDNVMFV